MSNDLFSKMKGYKNAESVLSAIYIGSIFITLGIIYYLYLPNSLFLDIINFFSSINLAKVPDTAIYLPAPLAPSLYSGLYQAAFQLATAIGIIEIIVLILRFIFDSPIKRKAETIANIVFWFGASYLLATYLVEAATINKWFVFWTGIIIFVGLSLIARAFVLLAKRQSEKAEKPAEKPVDKPA